MGQWIIKLVVFNRSGNCCRKTAVIARFLILGGIFKGQHFEYSKTIKRRRSKNNKIGSGKRHLDLSHSAIRGLIHWIMDTMWGGASKCTKEQMRRYCWMLTGATDSLQRGKVMAAKIKLWGRLF